MVRIKEVLRMAAQFIGNAEEVERYWAGEASEAGERDGALLLTCFHAVENELALDYLPLVTEETILSTGILAYASLKKDIVRVLAVENERGEPVEYKLFSTYVKVPSGEVKIRYAYKPEEKTIDGVATYNEGVSKRLLAYGVATEYFLALGDWSAANVWDKKYREAIRAAYRPRNGKRIPARRWI